MTFYNVSENVSTVTFWVNPIEKPNTKGKTESSEKLRNFLKNISMKLEDGYAIRIPNDGTYFSRIQSCSYVKEAVNEIQRKVCRGVLFWILSWIPYTSARETSLLFKQVQYHIEDCLNKYKKAYHPEKLESLQDLTKKSLVPSKFFPKYCLHLDSEDKSYKLTSDHCFLKALTTLKLNLDRNTEFTNDNFKLLEIETEDEVFETVDGYKLSISATELKFSNFAEKIDKTTLISKQNELLYMAFEWLLSETNNTQETDEKLTTNEDFFHKYLSMSEKDTIFSESL